MPPTINSAAIQLAEASDWSGLQRLVVASPTSACTQGDYGMLPIHWACTEARVPLSLLDTLLAAFPRGAFVRNDAALLPLHIAIRARVTAQWLERLLRVFPGAVQAQTPGGRDALALAQQVGLSLESIKVLHRALRQQEDQNNNHHHNDCVNGSDDNNANANNANANEKEDRPERDRDANEDEGDDGDGDGGNNKWRALAKVVPHPTSVVKPRERTVSSSSASSSLSLHSHRSGTGTDTHSPELRLSGDEDEREMMEMMAMHMEPLVSPSSSSCSTHGRENQGEDDRDEEEEEDARSTSSVNTAPMPVRHPRVGLGHAFGLGGGPRKHSLDYLAHAAAAAAATREHQELLRRGQRQLVDEARRRHAATALGATSTSPGTATTTATVSATVSATAMAASSPLSAVPARLRGNTRHNSLPVIPSFEHMALFRGEPSYLASPAESSDDDDDDDDDEQNSGPHSGRRRGHKDNQGPHSHPEDSLARARLGAGRAMSLLRRRASATVAATSASASVHGSGRRGFESPPEWKHDDECSICRASFGMFKHRHHCRNCGKSICSQHSADKKLPIAAKGFAGPQRVCVACYAMITHQQALVPSPSQPLRTQSHGHTGRGFIHNQDHSYSHGHGHGHTHSHSHATFDPLLDGATITGPVAAFHLQQQQQQQQRQQEERVQGQRQPLPRSHPRAMSLPPPSTQSFNAAAAAAAAVAVAAATSAGFGPSRGSGSGSAPVSPRHVHELKRTVAQQQRQLEQLVASNMQMQQQLLGHEEVKAETMLLITQLMTRVSELERHRYDQRGSTPSKRDGDGEDGVDEEEEDENDRHTAATASQDSEGE